MPWMLLTISPGMSTSPKNAPARWRQPGEGDGVSVEVGLVDVATVCRNQGGAVTSGETVSRLVERASWAARLGVRPIRDRNRDHRRLRLHPISDASRSTRTPR